MNHPTKNSTSDTPINDASPTEHADRREPEQNAGSSEGADAGKQVKRGLRGPRTLRRARNAPRTGTTNQDSAPAQNVSAEGAEGQAAMPQDANPPASGEVRRERGPRRDDRQPGARGPQKTRGKSNNAGPNRGGKPHSKVGDADEVFFFVTGVWFLIGGRGPSWGRVQNAARNKKLCDAI
jgi:23S rRNA pseudouridine2605 synthase